MYWKNRINDRLLFHLKGVQIHVVCHQQQSADDAHATEAALGEVDKLVSSALKHIMPMRGVTGVGSSIQCGYKDHI